MTTTNLNLQQVLWTKGIDILLALMHNARVSDGGDKGDDAGDAEVTVTPGAVVADATAAAAKLDEETSSAPPPPQPSSAEEAEKEDETGEDGGGAAGSDAKPFPIVLYGSGSDLDEVRLISRFAL